MNKRYHSIMNNRAIHGDLWSMDGVKIVSTNLEGIHGRGLAAQAKRLGLIDRTNVDFKSRPMNPLIITIAVKGRAPETQRVPGRAFSESVTGANVELLADELSQLTLHARANPDLNFFVPFIGLGFGEGNPGDILPMLFTLIEEPNIFLVSRDATATAEHAWSMRPGVRRDASTR